MFSLVCVTKTLMSRPNFLLGRNLKLLVRFAVNFFKADVSMTPC